MKSLSKLLTFDFLLMLTIAALAFGLRLHRYWDFPVGGETQDEVAWTYLGSSLLQTGEPTSWSHFEPYKENNVVEQREQMTLVSPALDHPPLFSLLPGLAHSLKNHWSAHPSIKLTRLPMVILGTLNVALLMLAAKKLFTKRVGFLLAGLFYAVAPSFVFSSRLVVAENLLVTWTLLSIYLLTLVKWKWQPLALVLVGALAVLTKVSGLVIPASILVYGLTTQNKKIAISGFLGSVLGVLSFLTYAAYYDFELFLKIVGSQAGRDLGWTTLQNRFFLHPDIVEKFFFDGWIFFGLFAAFVGLVKNKKSLLAVNIFLIVNLFFIALTSGEQTFHGWYDYVLYPLFVISIADLFEDIFENKNWLLFSLIWLMLLPTFKVLAVHLGIYHSFSSLFLRSFVMVGFLPFLVQILGFGKEKATNLSWLLLGLILIASLLVVFYFNQTSYWEEHLFYSQW